MNICLLNDSFPPVIDGVANTVMNYARVLSEMDGMSSIVGTPRYPKADYTCYPYKVVPYQSFNIAKFVEGYRAGNPLALRELNKLADFGPDIIHTHCPAMSTVMARALRNETGAPIVFTYHTKFDEDIAKAVKLHFLQEAGARILVNNISACDEVWAVSHGAGENLRSLGYEGEYRVVVNGVDFPKGRTTEEEAIEVCKDFDLPAEVPVFLFVGRIMAYKGLPLILDALKILSENQYDFRMVFIGGGMDLEEMKKKALAYGLRVDTVNKDGTIRSEGGAEGKSGKVIFTGPIRDRQALRAWNTRAHLFLFPSTYDTNGIVVREAAACGLASVLIEGSCAAEEITDERNGFLIPQEPEAMAAILEKICENPDLAGTVGENAMNEIYLSWDDSVKTAAGYYEELIEKKKAGLLIPRKKEISDRVLDAAALVDDAYRAIEKASRFIIKAPVTIAETTVSTTKKIIGTPGVIYQNIRSLHSDVQELTETPEPFYEGMEENFTDLP